jgi:hypothetical protein
LVQKNPPTDLEALKELLRELKAETKALGLPNALVSNISEMRKTITAVDNARKKRKTT